MGSFSNRQKESENSTLDCSKCQTHLSPNLKICPNCNTLVHSEKLKSLAALAKDEESNGQLLSAVQHWREALVLVPESSLQFKQLMGVIDKLSIQIEKEPKRFAEERKEIAKKAKQDKSGLAKLGAIGAGAFLLWKFKFILVMILTKGKLLVLGLTKGSTFFTMFLSFGVHWTVWGWKFALGLVFAIYVHEMGHVWALRRLGIAASAPAFIPGLGALVRLKQMPVSVRENARIGLAGPIWGLGISYVLFAVYYWTGFESIGAIVKVSAWINLFNLLPLGPLDGGRGFSAMSAKSAWWVTGVIFGAWYFSGEGLLVIVGLAGAYRAFMASKEFGLINDKRAVWEYVILVVLLTPLAAIEILPGV
jgi:Zn-dependent protease